nr:MAG TPA: hypothetical protein [Bacteriophage sp.]
MPIRSSVLFCYILPQHKNKRKEGRHVNNKGI